MKFRFTIFAAAVLSAVVFAGAQDKPAAGGSGSEKPVVGPLPELKSINLRLEMKEFGDDLRHSRSYREELLEEALKPFKSTAAAPANSGEALDRMGTALAKLDKSFREGWTPFQAGKYDEAIQVWKDQLNPARDEMSYRIALTRWFLGEAYYKAGKKEEAIFEYRSLSKKMPKFFSPAAMAFYKAGKVFEELDRKIRATEEWSAFVDNYSTADSKLAEDVELKLKDWRKQYSSLAGIIDNAADQMKVVKGDLIDELNSGKPTQKKQERIVSLLDDLILTLEEKEKEKDGGGGSGSGSGSGQGQGSGAASGLGQPSSPASSSALPGGETTKPGALNSAAKINANDDWGRLPVRERERILNALKVQFPERYHEIVKEYLKALNDTNVTERGRN